MKTFQREDTIRIIPTLTPPPGQTFDGTFTATAVPHNERPTGFKATESIGDKQGIVYEGLPPGIYDVYALITPDNVRVPCGQFLVQ